MVSNGTFRATVSGLIEHINKHVEHLTELYAMVEDLKKDIAEIQANKATPTELMIVKDVESVSSRLLELSEKFQELETKVINNG